MKKKYMHNICILILFIKNGFMSNRVRHEKEIYK